MMKSSESSFGYHPFGDIKALLEAKSISLPEYHPFHIQNREEQLDSESNETLFSEAMEGVVPISKNNRVERVFSTKPHGNPREGEDAEILAKLRNLVQFGTGFNIADTPEYIEGTGYHIHREIARRLHQGDYAIQAHVDLHGLTANDAKEVFEKFLKWSVTTGKRGILIIHGRGLSSPFEPVLKRKVVDWLTRGPWRKWIIAFSSARLCDGGAGATYVLLRERPLSRRAKFKHRH